MIAKIVRRGLFVVAAALFLFGATVVAGYYYLEPRLPSVETLKDVRFQVPLHVYSSDGKLLAEYGAAKREPVKYKDIPDMMIKAFLAAEDDRYFKHPGVDYQGILRALVMLAATGEKAQGGSTITMQVARNFFLSREKTFTRKFNEILLALKIDRELTKEEILELYLNKIFLGQRAYGIGAAAQIYYGKPLKDLSIAEMAVIAGLPKGPSLYNPISDPKRAEIRRNYVLGRMFKLGFITEAQYKQALAVPIKTQLHGAAVAVDAPYVGEMAREFMFKRYGEEAYTGGYKVYVSVDSRLQQAANDALRRNLLAYDSRHGYRGPLKRFKLGAEIDRPSLQRALEAMPTVSGLQPAVVTSTGPRNATALLADGNTIVIPWEGLAWARPYRGPNSLGPSPTKAGDVVHAGDVIYIDRTATGGWRLAQIPEASAALVALDPATGAIRSLVGGFDFYRSTFNRATQAQRQPGSSFKPFIYSAALEHGYTAASIINDAPIVFQEAGMEEAWRPENFTGKFYGPTRMREALAHSRNMVSIRLLQGVGVHTAIEHAKRFGFTDNQLPPNLSLALGTGSTTPLQLASAYAVFANGGYRVEPYLVERVLSAEGKKLYQAKPARVCRSCLTAAATEAVENTDTGATPASAKAAAPVNTSTAKRVISTENAFIMTSMLQDVIRKGTATKALALGRDDLAGKTGTTNEHRDAWFAGYNMDYVAVSWIGFDEPKPLGNQETGGYAALPIWMDFMRTALAGRPRALLPQPEGVVMTRIDPETGQLATAGQGNSIFEYFFADRVPQATAPALGNGFGADDARQLLF